MSFWQTALVAYIPHTSGATQVFFEFFFSQEIWGGDRYRSRYIITVNTLLPCIYLFFRFKKIITDIYADQGKHTRTTYGNP